MNKYLKDLGERVSMTFIATLAGVAVAAQPFNVLTFGWGAALTVAGSAAVLSLLKGLAARGTGPTDGAGLGT